MNTSQKGSLQIVSLIIIVLIIGLVSGYSLNNKNKVTEDVPESTKPISTSADNVDVTSSPSSFAPASIISLPAGYKVYTNKTIGFSTLISDKGMVSNAKNDVSHWSFYEGENPQFVYVYGPDPKTNIKTWILVWQEESGDCLPNLTDASQSTETKHNTAGYTYTKKRWGDAAMGQYEDLTINSIAVGKKRYCVIGQLHGSRPYNLEGKAYDDQEKINTAAAAEFMNVLNVFVDNFKFI